ncbi:hypothetical protein ACFV09_17240 [Streptomyces sp. NPDC059631]|uniref:hypothetical protein n=2 Tax=unclassified Streptomyces TaxID=2593676 RepID=UPI00268A6115
MRDRADGTASAVGNRDGTMENRTSAALPLILFSSATGILAVGAGALAALLVPDGAARGVVWLLVTALVAVGGGLWWGLTPLTERLRVLNRALETVQPRGEPPR